MVRMRRTRGWAVAVAAAGAVLVAAGCGGGGGDGSTPEGRAAKTQPAATAPPMTVEQAYAEYQGTMGPGCTTVEECQALVEARLHAAHDLRTAMQAEDPTKYAEPIGDVDRADRLVTQYGADQLGAAGNMQAVLGPVQAAITWYAGHR